MTYNLRRDDGAETQGESAEEAAALMRGLEDAEAGLSPVQRHVRAEFLQALRRTPLYKAVTRKFIRMPTVWPRADPDEVAKTVKGAEDAIGE